MTVRAALPALLLLAAVAALPLLSVMGHPGAALGDPSSELPIKLWAYETFPRVGLLGGSVDDIAFPTPGLLNNPDPVGTLVTLVARPALGRMAAVNLLVWLQLLAAMVATAALAWEVTRHRGAALFAAVAFALTPLTLVYSVSSAVFDMLNLWPYPLAIRSGLRALHRRGWRDGLFAGGWFGLGVLSCPYNALVFSILAVPLLPFVLTLWRDGPTPRPTPGPALDQIGRAVLGIAVGVALVAAVPTAQLRSITSAANSLIPADEIAVTRHAPPYLLLEPGAGDRYTAYAADYVAVGKGALVVRDNASRYYRAFSPGLVLLAAAVAGLALEQRRRVAALWLGAAGFAVLASLGPFLPVTGALAASSPVNPVWLGLHHLWPGGDLLLEPFRYGLAAALPLCVAGALGVAALARRFGDWVAGALGAAWLVELVLVSPVPVPLPVTDLAPTAGWEALDTVLPAGPIFALPYYEEGTDRLNRRHFVELLVHRRPIPDHVLGYVPPYLQENQFTASLLAKENGSGRLRAQFTERRRIGADRRRFVEDGFVGVVVDPRGYTPGTLEGVLTRLRPLGRPERVGELYVFRAR